MPYNHGQGDFWGTIGGALKGAVGGFITGGPIGAIVGGAGGAIAANRPQQQPVLYGLPAPSLPGIRPDSIVTRSTNTRGGFAVPGFVGGGSYGTTSQTAYYPTAGPMQGGGHAGYHLDKKTRSHYVRNRKMNPANGRALKRAIRREKAFVKMARSVLRGTGITIGRHSFVRKKGRK